MYVKASPAEAGVDRRQDSDCQPRPVFSLDEFQRVLEDERLRADRSGLPFSLIAIDVEHDSTATDFLLELIRNRIQTTDEVGWLRNGRLGIITPYTDACAAALLANDLVSLIRTSVGQSEVQIYEYATFRSPADNDEQNVMRSGVPAAGSDVSAIGPSDAVSYFDMNELLVRATPWWKRSIDVCGAGLGIVVLAPIFLLVALAIKLSSPGPVFFVQRRTGLAGQPFPMYKFRTMVIDAERQQHRLLAESVQDGPAFKMDRDPRITPVGHWLRRLSIDELPQLLNVLKGEMSLVGPRPLPCAESDGCQPWQKQRLTVTPGMTCSWQVLDRSTLVPFDQWMRMDVHYAQSQSPREDLKLLAKTVLFIIGLRGR